MKVLTRVSWRHGTFAVVVEAVVAWPALAAGQAARHARASARAWRKGWQA